MNKFKFGLFVVIGCALCWLIGCWLSPQGIALATLAIFGFTGLLCAVLVAIGDPVDTTATNTAIRLSARPTELVTQVQPPRVWIVDPPKLEVN